MKNLRLTRIEDWFYSEIEGQTLTSLFSEALGSSSSVFLSIYISIRRNPENTQQETTETFDYYNVGFTPLQIAEYFYTKYDLNFFPYTFRSADSYSTIKTKLRSIYTANKYKYMKLIESLGYRYNPLYNVDGIELYSNAESIGGTRSTKEPSGTIKTVTGTATTQGEAETIGNTSSTYFRNPYNNNSTTAENVEAITEQSAITSKQSFEQYTETNSLKHDPAYTWKYDQTEQKWKEDTLFSIAAKDSAFGVALTGPERYYAEKRIRQGNIGVTKSTELLRDQREIVKFNILDEFFKDIEPELIVGLYDV